MPHAALFLELGGVLLVLGLLGRGANLVGVSPIPLYLLTGLVLGKGGLYPLATGEEFIETGSQVGVVLLLLVLGLEYSADELLINLRQQAPAGLLDVVVNGLPGAAIALLLGWGATAAVAMAGITAVSSSGIIAKVLADLGRIGNRETPSVLSVLVLEDLSMAIYLPVLTVLLASGGVLSGVTAIAIAMATLVVVLFVALRFGPWISRLLYSDNSEVLLLVVLGVTLLVAGVAQQLQVSDAVGAFLVGIALSGRVAEGAARVLTPLRDLFAAAFFLFFGFSTDPASLAGALPIALALAVVGVATKLVSGWYAARRAGIGVPGRIRAGAALTPRGEFSIVIATLVAGTAFAADLTPVAAAYVLLMGVAGPLLPKALDPLARRLALRQRARVATRATYDPHEVSQPTADETRASRSPDQHHGPVVGGP